MLKSMNFLRGKSRERVSGGSGISPLAPVILGLVPRILWKQVSNLVNKFALLLHKCWLREDSWDKPKNDGGWGRGFNTCCSFFKYPSPDAKASPSPSRGEGMHRPWCDKILGTRPSMTGARVANSFGRSMIEMLGVLAIIGVLSVGGIAGYSKAMRNWKMNRAAEEYSYLIQGLLEHIDCIRKISTKEEGDVHHGLVDVIKAANLVPETWTEEITGRNDRLIDEDGNLLQIFSRSQRLVIDLYLGGRVKTDDGDVSTNFTPEFCRTLFVNVVQPLHPALYASYFVGGGTTLYGDAFCGAANRKCINGLSVAEIQTACSFCSKKAGSPCGLILEF